jgi:hypothetical protein
MEAAAPINRSAKMKHTMRDTAAADVILAYDLLKFYNPENRQELCSILRRWIAGLSAEQADKALIELFHEIDVCDEVKIESCGFKKITDEPPEWCPFWLHHWLGTTSLAWNPAPQNRCRKSVRSKA